MQCDNCGANFASDQLKCPYCGKVNEYALQLAKELQVYDKEYEKSREELLRTGESIVLKKITIGMGLAFLLIVVLFGAYVGIFRYRYGSNSHYEVTGMNFDKNKKLLKTYMDNKEYIRAYLLAASTDPTTEYFEYYPEYKDELDAIYNYSLIFKEIEFVMQDMDAGDNYRSLTGNQVISFTIFYGLPDSEVKQELQEELEAYLRNLYRLTDEEIEELRTVQYSSDFMLDGQDCEKVSKERMVAYFGK